MENATTDREAIGEAEVQELAAQQPRPSATGLRTLLVVVEVSFVAALLIWWVVSDSARNSGNLWYLFLYCLPSQFIIPTVPLEPAILYFARFTEPFRLSMVLIAGTLLVETINYTSFKHVADIKGVQKAIQGRTVQKLVALYRKAPFAALCIAAFTPMPFVPFRFLAVIARYPMRKYLLAILVARTPRFYLLGLAGTSARIPNWVLIVLFIAIASAANLPITVRLIRKRCRPRK
ncbi:MAG: hypothetical protein WAW06_02885 [bacterium]